MSLGVGGSRTPRLDYRHASLTHFHFPYLKVEKGSKRSKDITHITHDPKSSVPEKGEEEKRHHVNRISMVKISSHHLHRDACERRQGRTVG